MALSGANATTRLRSPVNYNKVKYNSWICTLTQILAEIYRLLRWPVLQHSFVEKLLHNANMANTQPKIRELICREPTVPRLKPSPADGSPVPYKGVKLGAVVLVVVGAVHGSVSHSDDPGPERSVLRPVGLLGYRGNTFKREFDWEFIDHFIVLVGF